jgi:formiminotetrahydrofolate cyclodeaminase
MGYETERVADFLEALGAASPAPASGTAAAFAAAMAAALAELSAGVSRDAAAVAHARELRVRLTELATEDAEAYTAYVRERTDETRARIVAVPQEIGELADAVAALGDRLARSGKPTVRGDALAATDLARGAGRAARRLVEINQ